MTNPTLERAARAADPGAWLAYDQDKSWEWARQRVDRSFEIARAVLMAVLPTLERYSLIYDLEPDPEGGLVYFWDLEAILNDGEGE